MEIAMTWFLKAFTNYLGFGGRAQRKEYWFFMLFYLLLSIVTALIDTQTGLGVWGILNLGIWAAAPTGTILMLVFLIPTFAVTFRRLHDTGRTAWWILIVLVPLIGAIVFIIFMCLDSNPEENKYGAPVKV